MLLRRAHAGALYAVGAGFCSHSQGYEFVVRRARVCVARFCSLFAFPLLAADLDHTADIQLHSWGDSLEEALEQVALAMFSYITDLDRVSIDPSRTESFEVSGHDWDSLLFNFLDELLYRFSANEFVPRDLSVTEVDRVRFRLRVTAYGEGFTLTKHVQGTEVKAITYSAMQIFEDGKRLSAAEASDATMDASSSSLPSTAAPIAASSAMPPPAAARASSAGEPAPGQEVSPPPEADVTIIPDDAQDRGGSGDGGGKHGAEIFVIVDI